MNARSASLLSTLAIIVVMGVGEISEAGHYEWRTQGVRTGWYYVPDASDYSQVWQNPSQQPQPVPQAETAPPVRIDNHGHTYIDGMYLGVAQRVRFRSNGELGWKFQIPRGWTITRRDSQRMTHASL